nr:helix-turn-helix domain-containing protein [Leucobacter ruminantium]
MIEAGLIEFGLFGYHGASTAAVARRADVPQPHVYASFRTKQELFLACFAAARAAIAAAPDEGLPERSCRLMLQAYAASGDPELREALSGDLAALREALGERRLGALLLEAARSLSEGSAAG